MSFRLSPLTIFLILLGVLLIGYMMGHVWENFCDSMNKKEGFEDSDEGVKHVDGYSTQSSQIVPLIPGALYFDPLNRVLVNTPGAGYILYMISPDGTEISFDKNGGPRTSSTVQDDGYGFVPENVGSPDIFIMKYGPKSVTTLGGAKEYFKTLAGDDIFMDVAFSSEQTGDTVPDTTLLKSFVSEDNQSSMVRTFGSTKYPINTTNAGYPSFPEDSRNNMFRRFTRVMDATSTSFNVANLSKGPIANYTFTSKEGSRYGVVHIPVPSTGVSFLHIIDLSTKQHVVTYFFNTSEKESSSFSHGTDIIESSSTSLSSINGSGKTPLSVNLKDIDFDVRTRYSDEDKVIHVVGSKVDGTGHTSFYVILSFTSKTQIKINYSSTKVGDASIGIAQGDNASGFDTSSIVTKLGKDTDTTETGTGTTTTPPSVGKDLISTGLFDKEDSILTTMARIKLLKSLFGSSAPSEDYVLKTEVVPPVSPNCPNCRTNNGGVCTDCGGHGGCGSNHNDDYYDDDYYDDNYYDDNNNNNNNNKKDKEDEDDISDLIRDGAEGAVDLIRDGTEGAVDLLRDGTEGAVDLLRDGTGGAVNLVKDAVTGVYGAASDVVGGTVGLLGVGNNNNGINNGINSSNNNTTGTQRPLGQDPYSYFGAVPARNQGSGSSNFVPRLADFSHFGK